MGAEPTGAEPDDGGLVYQVVVNDEEQYSIWEADRQPPSGWRPVGVVGHKQECLSHIGRVWLDVTPLSIRVKRAGRDEPPG